MVTSPHRPSRLANAERRAQLEARAHAGTSDRRIVPGDVLFGRRDDLFGVYVPLAVAEQIARELLPRVRFGGGGGVATPSGATFAVEHADTSRWEFDAHAGVVLWLTPADALTIERDLQQGPGNREWANLSGFEIGVFDDAHFAAMRDKRKSVEAS